MNEKSKYFRWGLGLLGVVLVVTAGVMGYLLTKPETLVPDGQGGAVGKQRMWQVITSPKEWFGKKADLSEEIQPNGGIQQGKGMVSYGEKNGVETRLVQGKILRWGETWVEVEGNDGTNYPLLLPEKTVRVRCLPLIITTGDGKEFPTREVYVDMTQGTYWGRLMSIYSAQTMLPTGSEVLTFVEKEAASGEVKPRVLAGYGCSLGERDPLESAGSAQ